MAELPETRISLLCKISQNPHDSQGWSELVALYQAPIYRTLRCRRLQHADAMEVTQQVLVTLVRYLPQFERDGKPASFRRWLNRIISNLCWKAWSCRQNPVANARPSKGGWTQIDSNTVGQANSTKEGLRGGKTKIGSEQTGTTYPIVGSNEQARRGESCQTFAWTPFTASRHIR